MVSWLPHILVPTLLALAFFPMARKRILLWSPLALAPDLDFVFQPLHRTWSHSVFLPLGLFAAAFLLWRLRDPAARLGEYLTRPGAPGNLLLASYYLASHIVMDAFFGGVVLFWPLWNMNVSLGFILQVNTRTNEFIPTAEASLEPGPPTIVEVFTWITYEHSAVLAFLAFTVLAFGAIRLADAVTGRRRLRPVVVERVAIAKG